MSIKGSNSVKILQKMTGNNPKLDLVNVDVHTKFGQILSICSQDIERKRNFFLATMKGYPRAITLLQIWGN